MPTGTPDASSETIDNIFYGLKLLTMIRFNGGPGPTAIASITVSGKTREAVVWSNPDHAQLLLPDHVRSMYCLQSVLDLINNSYPLFMPDGCELKRRQVVQTESEALLEYIDAAIIRNDWDIIGLTEQLRLDWTLVYQVSKV